MLDLRSGIYDYLITELGAYIDDRVLPVRGSEGEVLPYVTQQGVSSIRRYTHDPFPDERAWVTTRIQFSCWATTMVEADTVGDALIGALSGFSGPLGDLDIGRCDVLLDLDDYQESTKLYRRIIDVEFAYEEGVVTGS